MTEPERAVRLAQELRELRRSAKLTQAGLAKIFAAEKPLTAATVSSWESTTNPKVPPDDRLDAYARLFAVSRALVGKPQLIADSALTGEEQASVRAFLDRLQTLEPVMESGGRSTLVFDQGPVMVICPDAPDDLQGPLARERDPNFTKLHRYADLDGLIELYGHLRANNPLLDVIQKLASEAAADDLTSDLVVLGGIGWNEVTEQILDAIKQTLPVTQVDDPELPTGEPFVVDGQQFYPTWSTGGDRRLKEDIAFLARLPNPYNVNRTLTICNGIHSRGVLGAVRCLTDHMLREPNERYLAERFPGGTFALLLRVRVVGGQTLTPDLQNPDTRLFEWPAKDEDA